MQTKHLFNFWLLLCLFVTGGGSFAWADGTLTFDATTAVTANVQSYQAGPATYVVDGYTWTVAGYGATAYTQIVIGKGGANYLETPVVPAGTTINSVTVTWSGNTSYYLALQTTSGTELEAKANPSSASTESFTVASGDYTQLRLVGRRNSGTNNAAATITRVVVSYKSSKSPAGLSFGGTTAFNSLPSAVFTAPTLSNPNGLTVSYATTDADIAAVNASTGAVIIGTKEGTVTITASSEETETYAAGEASYTITVTNAIHTVTFSINGNTTRTASVVEGEEIPFPSAVASPSTANEFARENNGFTFVGWAEATIAGTANSATLVTEPATMGDADKTYYAVYAEETEEESDDVADAVLAQTLQYDTWTYSGSTTDKDKYRLFHSDSYIESAAFDLSKLMKVIVYGGTFGGSSNNELTIGDGTNTWKNVTVSGSNETGPNEFSGGSALTGTKALRVTSKSGTATGTGVRISKVEIFVKGTRASYTSYCTTVSTLPKPELTMGDVEMTWGDADKRVAATATVNGELLDETITYTCDDDDLTIAADGTLTCNTPGTYTVTASVAATAGHRAAETTCTVTVNKKEIEVAFAQAEVTKLLGESPYWQSATVTTGYDGTLTYSIVSFTSAGASLDAENEKVIFSATGDVVIKATAAATALYNAAEDTYTLKIRKQPTITVSDQSVAYGAPCVATIEGGELTATSAPAGFVTVEGTTVTAAAVGTATVTLSTAADDTYIAGEETFTLTVTAPAALSAVPVAEDVTVFYESFDECNSSGGNDGSFDSASSSAMSNDDVCDNDGWNGTLYKADRCVKLGGSKAKGVVTTPALGYAGNLTLTFKAAAWKNDATEDALVLSTEGDEELSASSFTLKDNEFTTFTITISGATVDTKVKFSSAVANRNRFFLDEVKVTCPGSPISSVNITIPASGIGTYCSEYPLDFSNVTTNDLSFKAYTVKSIDGSNITLEKITSKVKGGVPFIITGKCGETVSVPTGDSNNVPENLLRGTLAPTYVEAAAAGYHNYGMSGGKFKRISSGIVPANRAYLPIADAGEAREFSFIFVDETTGVSGATRLNDKSQMINEIFDLQGRRVAQPKRGLYIVNGKKMVVK